MKNNLVLWLLTRLRSYVFPSPVVIGQFQEHVKDMSTPQNFGFRTEYEVSQLSTM